MSKQNENIHKEMENLKKKPKGNAGAENRITKIKNLPEVCKSRDELEKRIH